MVSSKQKTLDGIVILDLSQFISGPYGSSFLADQGAEVIKIEPPGFGEALRMFTLLDKQLAPLFSILNRNKKSVSLDLNRTEARDAFLRLVDRADVVLENFVPGTMGRWGLGWDVLHARNPRLIHAAISGFGQTGPRSSLPAFDLIAQAAGGILHASGIEEGTPRIPFADYSSGLAIALGIMQALFHRERHGGEGQFVDLSMQDLMYTMNIRAQVHEFMDRARARDVTSRILPTYNQYPTRDHRRVVLVTLTEKQYQRLMAVMGRQDLLADPRLGNVVQRMDHVDLLDEAIASWTMQHDQAEIEAIMREARVPCSPVVRIEDLLDDVQLAARGMFNTSFSFEGVARATLPNPPVSFSATPGEIHAAAPALGQHNGEVLGGWLGIDETTLKQWKRKHVT